MLFKSETDEDGEIYYIHEYHPYHGGFNPSFDATSGRILELKEMKESAVKLFASEVEDIVNEEIVLCVVPSHDSMKLESGIRNLAKLLVNNNRVDGTSCLVINTTIPKLANGGLRTVKTHLDSVSVKNECLFKDKEVLILDDVTTSGTSLEACIKLIKDAGALKVCGLAIGKTI